MPPLEIVCTTRVSVISDGGARAYPFSPSGACNIQDTGCGESILFSVVYYWESPKSSEAHQKGAETAAGVPCSLAPSNTQDNQQATESELDSTLLKNESPQDFAKY